MPKAILAIRSYPATLLLAVLLFLATLIITTGSLGTVGSGSNGGDSDDGGSGIGGTGRSGEFGGSGFGGTGSPSPFFTSVDPEQQSNEESGKELPVSAESHDASSVVMEIAVEETPVPVISPVDQILESAIEETVELHPLAQESQIVLAADEPQHSLPVPEPVPTLQIVEAIQSDIVVPSIRDEQVDVIPDADREVYAVVESAEPDLALSADVNQPEAEAVSVKMDTALQSEETDVDRRNLPERIQRPELPPFQRIRPVDRVSIMPPRVQPMRI